MVKVNVLDAKKLEAYARLAAEVVEARGGAHETTEGSDYARHVIVSWPDMAQHRLPITALNIKRHEMFWVMAPNVCL